MASHHPSPLCSKLYFLCISLFCSTATRAQLGASLCVPISSNDIHGGTGGAGRVWSMPRLRGGSISAGGSQELSDLSASPSDEAKEMLEELSAVVQAEGCILV